MGAVIINVCAHDQYRDIAGIHLCCPDAYYLNSTVTDAPDKGHTLIFCHFDTHGADQYRIPCDVLNRFMEMSAAGARIVFTHPARMPV